MIIDLSDDPKRNTLVTWTVFKEPPPKARAESLKPESVRYTNEPQPGHLPMIRTATTPQLGKKIELTK